MTKSIPYFFGIHSGYFYSKYLNSVDYMPLRFILVLTDYQKTKLKIKVLQRYGYGFLGDNRMDILFLVGGSISKT